MKQPLSKGSASATTSSSHICPLTTITIFKPLLKSHSFVQVHGAFAGLDLFFQFGGAKGIGKALVWQWLVWQPHVPCLDHC